MSDDAPEQSAHEELDALQQQAGEFISQARFASSSRLYGELRRRAKAAGSYFHYTIGTFFEMSQANSAMNYEKVRDRAVELISLTEDEERARRIEPAVDIALIEHMRYTVGPCAYENLADATGITQGYNSDGMHSCIADGLQVCRQTGKMSCVDCFREYSIEVYAAADDFEMALHNCRTVLDKTEGWSERGDRRWLAALKASRLLLTAGRFAEALEMADRSVELHRSEGVSIPICAAVESHCQRNTAALAAGAEELPEIPELSEYPPREEDEDVHLQIRMMKALRAAVSGHLDEAGELLTAEDRFTRRCSALHYWFEVRLRLIAVRLLQGNRKQADALAAELEEKAQAAGDWLTLRRLASVMESPNPSPVAPWHHPKSESTASAAVVPDASDATGDRRDESEEADGSDESAASEDGTGSELEARLKEIQQTFLSLDFSSEDVDAEVRSLGDELLGVVPENVTHPDDAALLVHMMGIFLPAMTDDLPRVWEWANSHAAPHQENGLVLSVLGGLADRIRGVDEEMSERITSERAEQLHRKALSLPPERANNWFRAGTHFLIEENEGEAERCMARAFRLDRSNSRAALRLADIYDNSDRSRDALMVLDLCLREGADDPEVAFKAAMSAMNQNQHEAMLTYIDRYEQMAGENPWLHYYRAVGLYELEQYEGCIAGCEAAVTMLETDAFQFQALRAAARIRLGQSAGVQGEIEAVLNTPLYELEDLAPKGIMSLMVRLHGALKDLGSDGRSAADRLWLRLLRSGLIDEDLIDTRSGESSSVRLFHCVVRQPLDERFESDPDRMDFQLGWPEYVAIWGVLAKDEEAAGEIALEWQQRCAPLPPELLEVSDSEQEFEDASGVVFQGDRFPPDIDDDVPGDQDDAE